MLGVFVVTFLLSMEFLFDYLDLFLGKGIDLLTVLWLFFLGLGWMLALSIPCGVLVGMLMTYGRLAQDSEIVAMMASGISPFRAMRPALWASIVIAVGLMLFNNYVLPDMNHAFAGLLLEVNKTRPTAEIQEGVFIDDFKGYNLFIGSLDDKTSRVEDILIYDFSRKDEPSRIILAKRGRFEFDRSLGILSLHLVDGEIHETDREEGTVYRRMAFQKQTLNIRGVQQAIRKSRERSRGQRELPIGAMRQKIARLLEEQDRYSEKSRQALEAIGLTSVTQLPGMAPDPPWYAGVVGLLGWKPKSQEALPDTFWTSKRRRRGEEAKVTYWQATAAAKKINQYEVEIQKKLAIPVACIVFALLGAPLGVRARRGGMAAAFISVGFFLFYYLCLMGGEQLADRRHLPPWVAMWLANLVLGLLGLGLTMRTCQISLHRRSTRKMSCARNLNGEAESRC